MKKIAPIVNNEFYVNQKLFYKEESLNSVISDASNSASMSIDSMSSNNQNNNKGNAFDSTNN